MKKIQHKTESQFGGRDAHTSLNRAIDDLFDLAEYSHIEHVMWEWMKAAVCEDFHTRLDKREKDFLFMMYERVNNLIRVAYMDSLRKKHKQ